MSEFFKDFEDDHKPNNNNKKPYKFKDNTSSEHSNIEKISNRDKKLQDLQEEIFQLEETYHNKDIDQFLKNIKKYKIILKDGMPTFLYNFLTKACDHKISSGTKHKIKNLIAMHKVIDEEIIEERESVENVHLSFDIKEDREERLNSRILDITRKLNYEQLVNELYELKDKCETQCEKCKVCLSLLNAHIKNKCKNIDVFCGLIDEILTYLNDKVEFMGVCFNQYFENHIDVYLDYMITICNIEQHKLLRTYFEKTKHLNNEIVCRKELEFIFYVCNENIDNNDKIYRLLYLIRSNLYTQAVEYYKENTKLYDNYLRIKGDLGIIAFEMKDYMFAFDILQQCYFAGQKEHENLLFILCIVLESSVIDSDFFDIFIESISVLEDNIFMLKMDHKKGEIFRAYYMLKNDDYANAEKIFSEVKTGFKLCDAININS